MVRNFVAVVCGLIAGVLVVGIVESIGHLIFPPPLGIDPRNPDDLAVIMETVPFGAKLAVLVAWSAGIFAGGTVAIHIANGMIWPTLGVAGLLFLGSAWTMFQIPHPAWMVIGSIVLTLGSAYAAIHVFSLRAQVAKASETGSS